MMIRRHMTRPPGGMTLLELLLALALSGLILYAISVAIDLHLRTLDARRSYVEEARLARSVLNMIAGDLRSTLRYEKVDMSGIEQLALASAAGAADDLGASLGLPAGSTPQPPPPAGGDGGGPPTNPGEGGQGGGAPPSSPGGGGGSRGGGGGAGGAPTGGSATPPLSGSAGGFSTESFDPETMEPSAYTMDLASGQMLPPIVGLYGNQFELQIDVSRIPRVDEWQAMQLPNEFGLPDIPSDVKTISYFVQDGVTGNSQVRDDFDVPVPGMVTVQATGLVRREVDRSVAQYALNNGLIDSLVRSGDLVAPEISAIQFQYFNGMQWLPFWDSQQMQGLPLAVEVVISVTSRNAASSASLPWLNLAGGAAPSEATIYRVVVGLPLGEFPVEQMYGVTDSGMQNLGF